MIRPEGAAGPTGEGSEDQRAEGPRLTSGANVVTKEGGSFPSETTTCFSPDSGSPVWGGPFCRSLGSAPKARREGSRSAGCPVSLRTRMWVGEQRVCLMCWEQVH